MGAGPTLLRHTRQEQGGVQARGEGGVTVTHVTCESVRHAMYTYIRVKHVFTSACTLSGMCIHN